MQTWNQRQYFDVVSICKLNLKSTAKKSTSGCNVHTTSEKRWIFVLNRRRNETAMQRLCAHWVAPDRPCWASPSAWALTIGLFGREIIFEEFQPMWSWYLNVTDRRQTSRHRARSALASRSNNICKFHDILKQTPVVLAQCTVILS